MPSNLPPGVRDSDVEGKRCPECGSREGCDCPDSGRSYLQRCDDDKSEARMERERAGDD